ncbi:hypothetical protein DYY67_0747 [Candidatus Nitrosotalea sp. TS]|nr:hypothetical protein [Candidatus Nitrosotalea sp. TS]NHI02843.1 hypothetical protein [Candidatus Nitrosotalea sp. TS]
MKNQGSQFQERVSIYDADDERLRVLGEVLVTDTSRTVLKLLFDPYTYGK